MQEQNFDAQSRLIAQREQALKDLATAVGAYYHDLRAARIPRELAFQLVVDYQQHWFEVNKPQ